MKRAFTLLAVVLFSASAFGQGKIFFYNRTLFGDVRIYAPDGISGAGTLGTVNAQLFVQPTAGGDLVPLNPSTTFRTDTTKATYFVNPSEIMVPGVPAGASANIVLRVWQGADYASAKIRGESAPFTIAQLGGFNPETGKIIPTPDLTGLVSFSLVPEPF